MKIIGVCLVLIMMWTAWSQSQIQPHLAFFKGEVTIKRGDKTLKASKKMILRDDDLISVKRGALAIIKSKASIIKLSGLTHYKLDLKQPEILNGRLNIGTLVIKFFKDKLSNRNRRKRQDAQLYILTETASLGVRGTKLFVHHGEKVKTFVTVDHGTVHMKGKKQEQHVELTKNDSSLVNIHHEALEPRSYDHEDKINWELDENSDKLHHHEKLIEHLERLWFLHKKKMAKKWNKKTADEENAFERQRKEMENKFNQNKSGSPFGEGGFPSN